MAMAIFKRVLDILRPESSQSLKSNTERSENKLFQGRIYFPQRDECLQLGNETYISGLGLPGLFKLLLVNYPRSKLYA